MGNSILEQMTPIGLDDMKAVRLMNRVDRKYMASADVLEELLSRIADSYFVQQIPPPPCGVLPLGKGESLKGYLAPYRTLYFDTDDLRMYTMHHNKKLNRQKPASTILPSSATSSATGSA